MSSSSKPEWYESDSLTFLRTMIGDERILRGLEFVLRPVDTTDCGALLIELGSIVSQPIDVLNALLNAEFEKFHGDLTAVLRGGSLASKTLDAFLQQVPADMFLKPLLRDFLYDYVIRCDSSFEIDPDRIRDELNNQYETEEEKEQAVLVALEENLERLRSACTALVDTLCDENSPVQPPYEVRAAAHLIAQCARAYQTDPVPLIGGFIILRYINPSIIMPNRLEIVDDIIHPFQRRKLVLISKVLQNLSNSSVFGEKEAWMVPMNSFIESRLEDFRVFLLRSSKRPSSDDISHPSRRLSSRLSISPISTTDERLRPESVVDLAQSFYGIVKRYAEPLNDFFSDHYPKSRLVSSLSMSLSTMEEIEEKLRVHLDLEQRLPEPSVGRDVQAEEKFDLREDEKMSLEEGDVVGDEEYRQLLLSAQKEDFQDFKDDRVIYFPGTDREGRRIVVLVGSRFPRRDRLDRFLLFLVHSLDDIVKGEYVLIFCHAGMISDNRPPFSWLRRVYRLLNRRYKKNLKQLFLLHPSFWLKTFFRIARLFISGKFYRKVHYVDGIESLFEYIHPSQIPLPIDVLEFDVERNRSKTLTPSAIFGVPLSRVEGPRTDRNIPVVFERAVADILHRGCHELGIFRVPGSETTIRKIRQFFELGYNVYLEDLQISCVTSMLKLFLRELPDPIFRFENYARIVRVGVLVTESREEEAVSLAREVVDDLPRENFVVLVRLMELLDVVLFHSEVNRMTSSNLATVFSPTCIRPENDDPVNILREIMYTNSAFKLMLDYRQILFGISSVTQSTDAEGTPESSKEEIMERVASLRHSSSQFGEFRSCIAKAMIDESLSGSTSALDESSIDE